MFELSVGSLYFVLFLVLGPVLLRNQWKYRNILFLVLNLMVYAGGLKAPMQLVVAALWTLIPYFVMKYKKSFKVPAMVLMVLLFTYFMQYDFIYQNLHIPYIFVWKLLGLSYFLFRQIDYMMQYEYLEEMEVRISLVDYLNYLLSFWTLLAGPIQRYEDFVTDFYTPQEALDRQEIMHCLNRALNGYLKVFVVSSIVSYYAQFWFDGLKNHGSFLKAAVAFAIFAFLNGWYIYFNFSGYCDIVIAFAGLAGFTVPENFNRPYLSRSVVEFWNRHHITLSEWIRDYIYSPLFKKLISGPFEKHVKGGQYLALFLTFTIAGVWHGTNLNYLVYGLFQGLGIVVATIYRAKMKKQLGKVRWKAYENNQVIKWVEICCTWMYICLTFSFVGYDVIGLL